MLGDGTTDMMVVIILLNYQHLLQVVLEAVIHGSILIHGVKLVLIKCTQQQAEEMQHAQRL